ncbi:hypothetical protein F0L74_20305 [Chitinophaga agrisoli]|uniref:Uncharacterized protein n=1 Tax=Chitinophaga agrisoli TaxID=2607653 RepID=A0A5B2VJZ7_9BACT|nr:hypothetical protein [Chitinophaga agrisoli]KAA2238569.1 hypothetical protein F0L74_20305 [Chitinophaga agrisoli]
MDEAVIPECFVDTNLIETLVPPVTRYNHQKGCGTVTMKMKKAFGDRFALGIIDKDKLEVDYLKEFIIVCETVSLILHRHRDAAKHHYIIQISPAMERFIMDGAAAVNISLSDFELPMTLEPFKKVSKSVLTKDDDRFKRLFRAMYQAGAEDMVRLARWVEYLKENRYEADLDVLKSL